MMREDSKRLRLEIVASLASIAAHALLDASRNQPADPAPRRRASRQSEAAALPPSGAQWKREVRKRYRR